MPQFLQCNGPCLGVTLSGEEGAASRSSVGPAGMWCGGKQDNSEASQLKRTADVYLALTEQDHASQVSKALSY